MPDCVLIGRLNDCSELDGSQPKPNCKFHEDETYLCAALFRDGVPSVLQ